MNASSAVLVKPAAGTMPRRAAHERPGLVLILRIGLMVFVLAAWQMAAEAQGPLADAVSSPRAVSDVLITWLEPGPLSVWPDIAATLSRMFIGLGAGLAGAVLLTALMAASRGVADAVSWLVAAANAAPKVALMPLFILWFGIGSSSTIAFVGAVIGFILFYNLYNGVQAIDDRLVRNVRALGGSRLWAVRVVTVPSVATWLLAGLRASAAYALLATILAEYLGANSGLGHVISSAQTSFQSDRVMAGMVLVGMIAVLLDRAVTMLDRRLRPWRSA